jgi:uncharacterized membrane protein YeiB
MAEAPSVSVPARPIEASERLALIDTLRGFALCGVLQPMRSASVPEGQGAVNV